MTFKQIKKYGAVPVLLAAGAAHAALPAGVEAAIGTAGDDLVTAGTAVVVAMIGFWAVRAVGKKLGFWA